MAESQAQAVKEAAVIQSELTELKTSLARVRRQYEVRRGLGRGRKEKTRTEDGGSIGEEMRSGSMTHMI